MSDQPDHSTALDSDDQQVGALYAKALLGSAGNSVDEVVGELEAVVSECLDANPGLETALSSPRDQSGTKGRDVGSDLQRKSRF